MLDVAIRPVENWVCGYTPILGLVIYDCLPDYVVPEFWRRPLMGPAFPSGFELKHPRPPGCNGGVCYCNHYHYCNDRWPVDSGQSHLSLTGTM